MTALRVTNLRVAYGQVVAVRDLNLTIDTGDVLVLLGPNGAGKTSAVEAIAGLLPKRRGKVEFFGEDIVGLTASAIVRKGLALVPQWRSSHRASRRSSSFPRQRWHGGGCSRCRSPVSCAAPHLRRRACYARQVSRSSCPSATRRHGGRSALGCRLRYSRIKAVCIPRWW